jgi:hypothetical protein
MAQPVKPSMQPSIHHPSRIDKAGDAVEGRLHAAGAGGFIGPLGRVHPDIDAGGKQRAQIPGVVFEIDNAQHVAGELGGVFDDLLDEPLAGLVLGMSLAGVENLQSAGRGGNLQSRSGSVKSRLARL